ncbi:MAG: T9SS type A sorting domain-containing protein [Bacteroidota bacterium]
MFYFFLSVFYSQASNITSATSGNWSLTSTWAGGVVPTSADSVIIANGHTISLSSAQSVIGVTLSGSAILNLTTSNATLTLSGDFSMNGTSGINGSSSSRVVNVAGNFSITSGANVTLQNIALNVSGTFFNSGTISLTTGSSAAKFFGNFMNDGTFTNSTNNVPITVGGDFTNNGTFTSGTGRVTFTGSASNTISGSTGTTAFDGGITVNKGTNQSNVLEVTSVITMSNGGLSLSNGTLKISSASTFTPFILDPSIPANARLWNNGGTINSSANINWTLNGAIRLDAGIINVGTATVNRITPNTASTLEVNGGTLNVSGRISPNSSIIWTFLMTAGLVNVGIIGNPSTGSESFMMNNSNDVFAMSGGTLCVVNGLTLGYLNMSNTGTGYTGGVVAMGSPTTISGSVMRFESTRPLYNLLINAPGSTVQIPNSSQIANELNLSAGNVDITGSTLTLGLSESAPGTIVRSAGYLYGGYFRRWFSATAFSIADDKGLFPMGTSSGDYRPLWLAYTSNLTSAGSVRVSHTPTYPSTFNNASHQDASWGNTLQGVSNSYWAISLTSITFNGSSGIIRFGGTGFGSNILTDLNASLNSSAVGTHGAATSANTTIEANRTGLTTATIVNNNWRIGTRNKINSPLPITFVDFTAEAKGEEVLLNWVTLTEKNSDYFTVEKSLDGLNFVALLKVPASGNTSIKHSYSVVDVSGNNDIIYYRLKQTDYNGTNNYFKIIAVTFKTKSDELQVFPNPTKAEIITLSNLNLNINSIELINESGEQVYFSHDFISSIDLKGLSPGVYYLRATTEDKTINKKILVEN